MLPDQGALQGSCGTSIGGKMDKNLTKQDRIAGGFYGLLIGDALGVPYEFYEAEKLPPYEEIEMLPPAGFRKTYPKVDAGTWSDDGAQALCLLESLLNQKGFRWKIFQTRCSPGMRMARGPWAGMYLTWGSRRLTRCADIRTSCFRRSAGCIFDLFLHQSGFAGVLLSGGPQERDVFVYL